MSVLTSVNIANPYNIEAECIRITTTTTNEKFTFSNVTDIGKEYTLQFWIEGISVWTVYVNGEKISLSSGWNEYKNTYTATSSDIVLEFRSAGIYHLYQVQLEPGNVATEWSISPDDLTEAINKAENNTLTALDLANLLGERLTSAELEVDKINAQIKSMVTDENGASCMTQTSTGWMFNVGSFKNNLIKELDLDTKLAVKQEDVNAAVTVAMGDNINKLSCITLGEYEYKDDSGATQTEPSIDLFRTGGNFTLKITNTRMVFADGKTELLTIKNKGGIATPSIDVSGPLNIGKWVWQQRTNGNLGLSWRG